MSLSINPQCDAKEEKDETSTPSTSATLVGEQDAETGQQQSRKLSWLSRWMTSNGEDVNDAPSNNEPCEDQYSIITRFLEDRPRGYPQVATFQSSDRNFLQYRGFVYLHSRVLSDMQFDIEQIETELDDLDRWEKDNGDLRKLSCKRRDSHKTAEELACAGWPAHLTRCRPLVLADLRAKLLEYDEFLLKCREMVSLQRPSNRDYESVRTWFRDNQPLVQREAQFIRRKEDIVTLRSGRESAVFDSLVERCLSRVDDFLQRRLRCHIIRSIFLTPELREKTSSGWVRYYAPARVDKLVNIIITVVIFILLILPVIIMYEVSEMGARQSALDAIGVLIVFTLIFGMAVSSLTTAKRHELFGASAAYAAVLVVFIGNFGVQQVEILGQMPSR